MLAQSPLHAATVPPGFTETLVASGLSSPTAMQFAPDGRLFVAEQGGRLRVIKDGVLLPTPFLTLTVSAAGERGLLGVAFDPEFATNRFVYVYYTATTPAVHNRISRFTANGDVAVAGSEVVLLDLDNLSGATNHNGGALAFGAGRQALCRRRRERQRRQRADRSATCSARCCGSTATERSRPTTRSSGRRPGNNRAIWALGLRNPFTFAFDPGSDRMFINDVGQNTWEEINDGIAGANYGWPETEGATTDPRFVSPRYAYNHSAGCAITGGAFYAPSIHAVSGRVPERLLLRRLLRRLDPQARSGSGQQRRALRQRHPVPRRSQGRQRRQPVLPGARIGRLDRRRVPNLVRGEHAQHHHAPVEPDRRAGRVGDVQRPRIGPAAAPLSVAAQRRRTSPAQRRRTTRSSPAQPTTARGSAPSSATTAGNVLSNEAVLTVTANQPPTGTITQPAAGTLYSGGSVINYAGTATDPEDGTLPASAFTWRVDFHHDTHSHPFVPSTTGAHERLLHDSDDRAPRDQRLVPHLPDRSRLRRTDADHVQGRAAAQGQPDDRDQSRRAFSCGWTRSRSRRR